jgi:hypothetical protein
MAMQRRANWTPAIVSNRAGRTEGETKISEADDAMRGPTFSALHVTYLDNADGSSEDMSEVLDRKIQRRADLRLTITVAISLALPVFIGIGIYIAMTAILRAS